jgi:hypothetical protein
VKANFVVLVELINWLNSLLFCVVLTLESVCPCRIDVGGDCASLLVF